MNKNLNTLPEREISRTLKMHPKKFALWLFIISIVMLFASLTSAYIVRQSSGNWLVFDMPSVFYWSTTVVIISSLGMQYALISAKKNLLNQVKIYLFLTFSLGIAFLYLQFEGWKVLVSIDVYFSGGNISGSFIYLLTGLHGLHLISGLIFIFIVLRQAFIKKVNKEKLTTIQMCSTYWHFLAGLWIYLFFFLLLNL